MENAGKERFELAMLDEYVAVNHWGTILTKMEIAMAEGGRYYPKEDMNYLGETLTVEEYMRLDMRQDGVQEENGQDRMQMEL
ncbi:MAG: hypothetical protein K2K90_16615 [Lachnospiraceae bacterium]|nr:hypothetical protein [Lachnospiraceae bacterium]